MNTLRAPVSSCIIETDFLHSRSTFYDVKTEALHLWGKFYNTELVLKVTSATKR